MAIEVDETVWNNTRGVVGLADALLKNPKTRRKYLEAVKEIMPNASIPEIDAAAPIQAHVSDIDKKMSDFMSKIDERLSKSDEARARRTVDRSIDEGRKMLKSRGYTEDGIKKIEELMESESIPDYNNATKLYEFDHPLATPGRPSRANMFDFIDETSKSGEQQNDYIKQLMATKGEDENVLNRQISSVLSDVRGR
jgi:hypothetical protein